MRPNAFTISKISMCSFIGQIEWAKEDDLFEKLKNTVICIMKHSILYFGDQNGKGYKN